MSALARGLLGCPPMCTGLDAMTLADVIREIERFDADLAIYAAPPWTPRSTALVLAEPGDGSLPELARGMTFVMRIGLARRAIAGRKSWRPDLAITAEQLCDAVLYYARFDEEEPLASALSAEINVSALL
jgi:hypothetical protein